MAPKGPHGSTEPIRPPARPPPDSKDCIQAALEEWDASYDAHQPCTISCPPDRHINIEFDELKSLTRARMSVNDQAPFDMVCQLIESMNAQEFMTLRRDLKHDFLPFHMGAKQQVVPTRVGKPAPGPLELDNKEMSLVDNIIQLMAAARFHLVTEEEWALSLTEVFRFTLPVDINWDFFDTKFLPGFWASTKERKQLRAALSPIADRILVFNRGMGVAEDSGKFYSEKIDLLILYLLFEPIKALWLWLRTKLGLEKKRTRGPHFNSRLTYKTDGRTRISSHDGMADVVPPTPSSPSAPQHLASGMQHKNAKTVERKTLRRLMPTVTDVLNRFIYNIELQEPMFKEVVVVYRTAGTGRAKGRSSDALNPRTAKERLADMLQQRNIHIKFFHDIPMADIEAIFPDKKVFLKSLSLVSMVVQAIMAFLAAVGMMWSAAGTLTMGAVWSILSMVGIRTSQMYNAMQYQRSLVMQNMVNVLYDKTDDAQEGVLSMMLEDMAEQQLKEAVLAYSLLLLTKDKEKNPAWLSQVELDSLCEECLEENFACKIDFAVEDTLPKLVKWGLVKEDKQNPALFKYKAVTVPEAHEALVGLWIKAVDEDAAGYVKERQKQRQEQRQGQRQEPPKPSIHPPIALPRRPLHALLPGGEGELQRANMAANSHTQRRTMHRGAGVNAAAAAAVRAVDEQGQERQQQQQERGSPGLSTVSASPGSSHKKKKGVFSKIKRAVRNAVFEPLPMEVGSASSPKASPHSTHKTQAAAPSPVAERPIIELPVFNAEDAPEAAQRELRVVAEAAQAGVQAAAHEAGQEAGAGAVEGLHAAAARSIANGNAAADGRAQEAGLAAGRAQEMAAAVKREATAATAEVPSQQAVAGARTVLGQTAEAAGQAGDVDLQRAAQAAVSEAASALGHKALA